MANIGKIELSGDDVLTALTRTPTSTYVTELNNEGKQLADLIAERIMEKLVTRLTTKIADED